MVEQAKIRKSRQRTFQTLDLIFCSCIETYVFLSCIIDSLASQLLFFLNIAMLLFHRSVSIEEQNKGFCTICQEMGNWSQILN